MSATILLSYCGPLTFSSPTFNPSAESSVMALAPTGRGHWPVLAIRTTVEAPRPRFAAVRSAAVASVAALCLGSAVFLAMPRLPASLVRTPPFTLGHRTPTSSSTDAVTNPGLPSAGGDGVVDFAPLGYPGFSSTMDLRARGALSEQIVFRVRADQPELWRAEVFDTYDGSLWTASDTGSSALSLDADTQSFEPGYPPREAPLPPPFSRVNLKKSPRRLIIFRAASVSLLSNAEIEWRVLKRK